MNSWREQENQHSRSALTAKTQGKMKKPSHITPRSTLYEILHAKAKNTIKAWFCPLIVSSLFKNWLLSLSEKSSTLAGSAENLFGFVWPALKSMKMCQESSKQVPVNTGINWDEIPLFQECPGYYKSICATIVVHKNVNNISATSNYSPLFLTGESHWHKTCISAPVLCFKILWNQRAQ